MDISTLNAWAEPVLIVLAATCWIFAAWQLHLRMNELESGQQRWFQRLVRLEGGITTVGVDSEKQYQLCRNLLNAQYEDFLELKKKVDRMEGEATKHHINAKVALRLSHIAHDKAVDALSNANGLKRSTHRVVLKPIEDVLNRNAGVIQGVNTLTNPDDEESEFMFPFQDEREEFEQARVAEAFLKNGL